jgi:hypothetical protein
LMRRSLDILKITPAISHGYCTPCAERVFLDPFEIIQKKVEE